VHAANLSKVLRAHLADILTYDDKAYDDKAYDDKAQTFPRGSYSQFWLGLSRAFDEKVESLIMDSHDGANRIQDPHWCKGGQS
jgi:hypothetical protein